MKKTGTQRALEGAMTIFSRGGERVVWGASPITAEEIEEAYQAVVTAPGTPAILKHPACADHVVGSAYYATAIVNFELEGLHPYSKAGGALARLIGFGRRQGWASCEEMQKILRSETIREKRWLARNARHAKRRKSPSA